MNKKIKIAASENAINIFVDGELTTSIKNEDKSEVSGETIFESLHYSPKDKYELEPFDVKEDEAIKNYKAAQMIYDLYKKIVEGINGIEVTILESDTLDLNKNED